MPVILAPPGSGKTTWVEDKPQWHDMDILYDPKYHTAAWNKQEHSKKEFREHYERIDRVVERDRKSKNIIGSLFYKLVPDAIVIIPEQRHRRFVAKRTGAESIEWKDADRIRHVLKEVARKYRVPLFATFDEAARHVALHQGEARK